MGRVRTKMVKRASRTIIEKHYPKLTLDFDTNKKITDEVSLTPSKRVRNKIAGFITHLMKRIQRGGSVRGISLKLQEEERERRLDFLPERSALDLDVIDVDADTFALLKSLEYDDIPGVRVAVGLGAAPTGPQRGGRPGGQRGGDRNQQRDGQRGGDRKPGTQAGQERKPRAGAAAPTAAATTPA